MFSIHQNCRTKTHSVLRHASESQLDATMWTLHQTDPRVHLTHRCCDAKKTTICAYILQKPTMFTSQNDTTYALYKNTLSLSVTAMKKVSLDVQKPQLKRMH